MYEFYHTTPSSKDWKKIKNDLKSLYESIPETEGCMKNINKKDGCGGWCCQLQSPSAFYSEFLYAWNYIQSNWSKDKRINLIIRSVENYLSDSVAKGCVFWDRETKLCGCHIQRPYNCRVYGQVPEDEFNQRKHKLRVLHSDIEGNLIKDQCDLVTSPKPPTKQEIDNWFDQLKLIESDLIDKSLHHDQDGGSYRQFHDHIILQVFPHEMLDNLTQIKEKGSQEIKQSFIEYLAESLEEVM